MKTTFEIPIHTILFTVAPSNSGKTYFCENILLKTLKEKYSNLNIQYLSSDSIRNELLGGGYYKHDKEMTYVSSMAFDLLYKKIDTLTTFPINAEIIIIDTRGMNNNFRNDLINFAKNKAYNIIPIIFDYDSREEYLKYMSDVDNNRFVNNDINKFKRETLKSIKNVAYHSLIKIKSKDFENYDFTINNYDYYMSHQLNSDDEYVVVGDVHGCLNELKEIIRTNNCNIFENNYIMGEKVFIIQDYIDKGYDILNTISFIHKNWKSGKILPILSNHENYVYKKLKGLITKSFQFEDEFFNSIKMLKENDDIREMFFELFENSKTFYNHKHFFVNHAPCKFNHLGKLSNNSLKKQRTFVYPKQEEGESSDLYNKRVINSISFIDDLKNEKPIFWGHMAFKKYFKRNNINFIDTGCVSGNKLTSVRFEKNGDYFYNTVESTIKPTEELLTPIFNKELNCVEFDMLESYEKFRISKLIENKVNFISGTMSPADKNENDIESLYQGLLYYKNNNIPSIVLEKKYMGSRCNIYLFKDISKSYAISRNGFKIKNDLTKQFSVLRDRLFNKKEYNKVELFIIDSELMPWRVLGEGLIDDLYGCVNTAITSEFNQLNENGFYDNLNELVSNITDEFKSDFNVLSKNDMIEKYSYRVYETNKNLIESLPEFINPIEYKNGVDVYSKQLELFGSDGEVEIKPFSILKVVLDDGSEIIPKDYTNEMVFKLLNDDNYISISFNDENWYEKALTFFNEVTKKEEMEGIVIKPEMLYYDNIAPYLKVRNPNYLHLIYGFDFKKKHKYEKLLKKRSIKKKLRTSIEEYNIGYRMLNIPYNSITMENKELINLYAQMILEERKERDFDPRL